MSEHRKRIYGLDILKTFSIQFVILYHAGVLSSCLGLNLEPLSRFVVPCFFMITGFFFCSTVNRGKEYVQIRKILVLILVSNAILILLNVINNLYKGINNIDWFLSLFSFKKLFNFLVFNSYIVTGHFESYHLWYLNSLLSVLLIAAICRKLGIFKLLYYLTPVLLAGGLIVECFSERIFGVNFAENHGLCYYRNFLTIGLPYFCIGNLLNTYWRRIKINTLLLLILFVLLLGASFIERKISIQLSLSSNGEFYLSTPFYSVFIFLFFYKYYLGKNLNKFEKALAVTGKKYVIWIYIFHLPIIVIVRDLFSIIGTPNVNNFIVTVITIILSLILAVVIDKTTSLMKGQMNRNSISGEGNN